MSSVAGPSRVIPTVPRRWEATVSATIDENNADVFLSSFAATVDAHYLPAERHFQLLLYLALSPSSPVSSSEPAIRCLGHLLSLYPPSALSALIPSISREKEGLPTWFKRDRDRDGENEERLSRLDRSARKFLRPAVERGVWALLWTDNESEGGDDVDDADADADADANAEMTDEEEGGQRKAGLISENGWRVLGLLVKLWQKDKEEHSAACLGQDWSPMFLAQLPHPYSSASMQQDDPSPVLSVLLSYLQHELPVGGARSRRNKMVAEGVMRLLIQTADYTTPPSPFHAPSLILALISLARSLPLVQLQALHTLLPQAHPILPHLLSIETEDRAGVRVERAQQRKRAAEVLERDFQVDWVRPPGPPGAKGGCEAESDYPTAGWAENRRRTHFPPPRSGYMSDLLALPLPPATADHASGRGGQRDPDRNEAGKMRWIKKNLMVWCIAHLPKGEETWAFTVDEGWRTRFKEVWASGEGDTDEAQTLIDLMATRREP